ncbi:MAG: peptidylprolyl isomerase [Streptococcaceae bacterium]|jgi:peptidyl-prolyl cis-trans isomerase A (cyclophilin A)|nr:peptidylprolyl isomerase [Streptococcaceae bacterium]
MKNKKNVQILLIALLALVILALAAFLISKSEAPTTSSSSSSVTSSSSSGKKASLDGKVTSQSKLNALTFPQLSTTVASDEAEIELVTSSGNIDIKLFPKIAPMAVENILTLAKQNYYNNNEFFRVINEFMIQTGDPSNTGTGSKIVSSVNNGNPFATEVSNRLYNIRGAVALANTGQANSSSSQFFIVQNNQDVTSQLTNFLYPDLIKDAYKNGGAPNLDGGYTVFGQVIAGLDIVDNIASGAVTSNSQGEKSSPTSPVTIQNVKILKDYNFSK